MDAKVLINQAEVFILDLAKTAFDLDAAIAKILFGYLDLQFFGKLPELLIQMLGFHGGVGFMAFVGVVGFVELKAYSCNSTNLCN